MLYNMMRPVSPHLLGLLLPSALSMTRLAKLFGLASSTSARCSYKLQFTGLVKWNHSRHKDVRGPALSERKHSGLLAGGMLGTHGFTEYKLDTRRSPECDP